MSVCSLGALVSHWYIPDTVWAAIVASVITLFGVHLANKHSRNHMTPKPPHRRMPLRYLVGWVVITAAVLLYQGGVPQAVGAWSELAVSALIGGALWGWILWRFGLNRKSPPTGEIRMADNVVQPRPRRGPLWAYFLGGLVGLPFVTGFTLGFFHLRLEDSGVQPLTVFLVGAVLGGVAYRIFSHPSANATRPSDLDV